MSNQSGQGRRSPVSDTTGGTTSSRQADAARVRTGYRFPGEVQVPGQDDLDDVHFMDDVEQDSLIQALQNEDMKRTEIYATILFRLTCTTIPFFLVKLVLEPSWTDVFSLTSLAISYRTVPTPKPRQPGLIYPGWFWLRLQKANVLLSCTICALMWGTRYMANDAEAVSKLWLPQPELLLLFPFVISLMGFIGRRFLEAISFDDLIEKRYVLFGA